jgi:hypothetical protein
MNRGPARAPGVSTSLTRILPFGPSKMIAQTTRAAWPLCPCGLLHATVNSPRISAKLVSVCRKCPKLKQKCPTFFRAFRQCFLCFHTHSCFERHFLTSFFCSIPFRTLPKALIRRHIRRNSRSFLAVESLRTLIPHPPPPASQTPIPNPRTYSGGHGLRMGQCLYRGISIHQAPSGNRQSSIALSRVPYPVSLIPRPTPSP